MLHLQLIKLKFNRKHTETRNSDTFLDNGTTTDQQNPGKITAKDSVFDKDAGWKHAFRIFVFSFFVRLFLRISPDGF